MSAEALPATIQQAVEKRIERLPEDLREVLSIASVIGKTFDSRELEKLAEGKGDIEDALDRLIQDGYLEEERESRSDLLTFSSGVVRDVLYAGLARRRRRSLHRRYAELLEGRYGGRLERVLPHSSTILPGRRSRKDGRVRPALAKSSSMRSAPRRRLVRRRPPSSSSRGMGGRAHT